LEEIEQAKLYGRLNEVILPVDEFLQKIPKVNLIAENAGFFTKGKRYKVTLRF